MFTRRGSKSGGAPGRSAFSLVELVIVVVILAILAAIAVPRVVSATHEAQSKALRMTLANVRKAIDLYCAEHGRYPGYDPQTGSPSGTDFVKQLTLYTDKSGQSSPNPGAPHVYGPYLRKPFPVNPINGLSTVHVKANGAELVIAGSSGWVAVLSTGDFRISAGDDDLDKWDVRNEGPVTDPVLDLGGSPGLLKGG